MSAATLPLESSDDAPRTTVEVARVWALALGLRGGLTRCFYPSALVPLAERWAAEQGWSPPDASALGRGLSAAGISLLHHGGRGRRLLLHRDDAARLRPLVWEAWAPRVPPGERPKRREQRLPLQCALARINYLKPTPPGFHAQLALDGARAKPVVDNKGRVYPSLTCAARALAAKREKQHAPDALLSALRRSGMWKGKLWRYLVPWELNLVPRDALCGAHVEALSWQQTCHEYALLTAGQLCTVRNGAAQGAGELEVAWWG